MILVLRVHAQVVLRKDKERCEKAMKIGDKRVIETIINRFAVQYYLSHDDFSG